MCGMDLPPAAPVPDNVLDIIGRSMTFPSRDVTSITAGDGFAFGARFDLNTAEFLSGHFSLDWVWAWASIYH